MKTNTLSRRDFLKAASSSMTAWTLARPSWMPRLSFAPQDIEPQGDLLVCVFVRGGMDGLNAIIPQFEDEYYRQRPNIAIPETQSGNDKTAIDLDGRFGLHPGMRPLKDIWDAGHLAIVHAAGSPDPTHSHFDAMDYMERGTPGQKSIPNGWIGRHLQTTPWQNDSVFRAVGMGGVRQASMRGAVPVTSLQSIADFHLQSAPGEVTRLQHTLADLYDLESSLSEAANNTLNAVDQLTQLNVGDYTPAAQAQYPEGEFGLGMMQVAQLAKAEIGLEVACVDIGGFDTHANQGAIEGRLAVLVEEFAQALAAFYHDTQYLSTNITLVTMSEFGRRVDENGNAGTDHGHGGVMFTMGSNVNGGRVFSNWPGLSPDNLYGPGDLDVTTDFRDVLGELVVKRLGNGENVETIFPGHDLVMPGIYQ